VKDILFKNKKKIEVYVDESRRVRAMERRVIATGHLTV